MLQQEACHKTVIGSNALQEDSSHEINFALTSSTIELAFTSEATLRRLCLIRCFSTWNTKAQFCTSQDTGLSF